MRRIRINVHDIKTSVVIEKGNETDVPMINNVFLKEKMERRKMNVNIDKDSREVLLIQRDSSKSNPVGVVASAY